MYNPKLSYIELGVAVLFETSKSLLVAVIASFAIS